MAAAVNRRRRLALVFLASLTGWSLEISRYQIALHPVTRRSCRRCHGDGGWWNPGPDPDMDACPCWADRPIHVLPLLRRRPPHYTEPPF